MAALGKSLDLTALNVCCDGRACLTVAKKAKITTVEHQSEESVTLLPEQIEQSIMSMRGHKVLLDAHLAALYGIETKVLTRAVRRNIDRFPDDFMFQLSQDEFDLLRCQIGTSSAWGGRRYQNKWGRTTVSAFEAIT